MTVCFFGIYDPAYSRNSILIKGLKANGVEVIECNATEGKIKKYFSLAAAHRKIKGRYDAMIVAFPGYQSIILAKLLTAKPVLLDAFFSIYDSEVRDRKITRRFSPAAAYYWLLDWLACSLADKVILDTNAHIDYFCRLLPLKREIFIRVLLGADDQLIKRAPEKAGGDFTVHFHGIATPLQGVGHIMEAARLLRGENIKFNLVGNKIKRYAKAGDETNINFIKTLPYRQLIDLQDQADVCLGVFGGSEKTRVVIPNKVYEALAAGKAVISADTPALRELLVDGVNCLFCRTEDGKDLADKIMALYKDENLRLSVATKGHDLFKEKLFPQAVTAELAAFMKKLIAAGKL